jgi:hypothetical protein
MGLSTAGLAFKQSSSTPSEQEIIRLAFGDQFSRIPDNVMNPHEIRRPDNIDVESTRDAIFIYNNDTIRKFFFELEVPHPSFLDALGNPQTLMFFCHSDSGGSFGYRIFKNGLPVRLRFYDGMSTIDEGTPMEFEFSWLDAEHFFEEEDAPPAFRNRETGQVAYEGYVTAALLQLAMKECFGTCPWDDWNSKTKLSRYYKTLPIVNSASQVKRPWWKRMW